MGKRWVFLVTVVTVFILLFTLAPVISAAPHSDSIIHVVRPGETLYGIARYYGVDMWALARANGIVNPNRIYVGQRLVIPTGGVTGFIHVVQRGETLTSIALRYGVSVWAIAQANGIYDLNRIWVGQRLLIPGAAPTTPPPSPSGGWYGQYYNNLTLTDPPCATRYDASIDFNWGNAAPMAGVSADGFSVRWTRTVNFAGGNYRFYARVDDGVRVWVDGTLIIDQWTDGAVRTFSADRTLTAGNHDLRVEFYDRVEIARIHFWWERLSDGTVTPTPTATATAAPSTVWHGAYYNNSDLREPPVAEADVGAIGFEWGSGSPMPGVWADNFSVRWTRTAYFNADTYRFCMMIDDGGRIYVDGAVVVDEWHLTNAVTFCGERYMTAGNHTITVEYFEWTGNALIYVWWEPA